MVDQHTFDAALAFFAKKTGISPAASVSYWDTDELGRHYVVCRVRAGLTRVGSVRVYWPSGVFALAEVASAEVRKSLRTPREQRQARKCAA